MQLTLSETWVSGEPDCPDGTFAAGYTMDAWERWRIVCLAALFVEDIEDIYLFRNHDNRYFADWIRLCPGLSKNSENGKDNSENGNSCPKPHKAARMIEAVGRAVSIETETIIAIWILSRRSSRLYKGKIIIWRPKWTERVACKIGMRLLDPKTKQSYLFLAPLHSDLGKAVVQIKSNQITFIVTSPQHKCLGE